MSRVVLAAFVLTCTLRAQTTVFGEPPPMETTRDVAYGSDPAQKLDVYRPRGASDARPAVLWFHGGGWQSGDKGDDLNGIRDLAPMLVDRGYIAISCNYRLAPAHRHPAQVNDAARAVRWVRAHAANYGVDPDRVGVVGISAGGHLACMLAVHAPKTGDEALDRFSGKVEAAVSLNGVTDLRPGAPTNKLLQTIYPVVVGDDPEALASMSPITFVTKRAAPLLLVVGDEDDMVPVTQSQLMADSLKEAGAAYEFVTIRGAGHGIFPSSTPQARDVAVDFFDRRLKASNGVQ